MGILGLTHDDTGAAFQTLPVRLKVAIGEGPDPGNEKSHPIPLDHFVFKRKTIRGKDVAWVPAPDIAQAHGDKPTELGIIFLNDDPREVLRTEYAMWTTGWCKCRGDLVQVQGAGGLRYEMQAVRKTQNHPEGEPWPGNYKYLDGPKKGQPVEPCGEGCPDLEGGDCGPSGDLYFILEKFPVFGSICRLHTGSYRSVRNLSNGLMQIRRLNHGRLTGVKAILKANPERISYKDSQGTRHTKVAHILSIEIGARDLRTLVASMTEPIRLLDAGRSGIDVSEGTQFVARESDVERAAEIAGEFYPQSKAAPDIPSDVSPRTSDDDEQLARTCDLTRRLGYNDGQTRMLIGQWRHDLAGLERKLRDQMEDSSQEQPRVNGGHQPNGKNHSRQEHHAPAAEDDQGSQSQPGVTGFLY